MSIENLITMANQIGDFFVANPDQEQAKQEIASHIKRFWAARMRQQLIKHVQSAQGAGLIPIVSQAVQQHETLLS